MMAVVERDLPCNGQEKTTLIIHSTYLIVIFEANTCELHVHNNNYYCCHNRIKCMIRFLGFLLSRSNIHVRSELNFA